METLYTHDQNGQQYPEHRLTKRDSLVLVARLSPEFTAHVVDRWQELESQAAPALPDFSDPVAAARAWADELEQKRAAMKELEGDHYKKIVVQNLNNTTTEAYELAQKQCILVVMRESKGARLDQPPVRVPKTGPSQKWHH